MSHITKNILRGVIVAAVAIILFVSGVQVGFSYALRNFETIRCSSMEISPKNILQEVSYYRYKNNLGPVVSHDALVKYSSARSEEIIKDFNHKSAGVLPDFNNFIKNNGFSSGIGNTQMGEVIAEGYQNACQVVQGWDKSQTHKDVILNGAYRFGGVGVKYADNRIFVVAVFSN